MHEIKSLRAAILATIRYFNILDFAPTAEEIYRYLYGIFSERQTVESALQQMDQFLVRRDDLYCLPGREQLIEKRKKSLVIEKTLWDRVERYRGLLEAIPFVNMIAVCNSVALGNVTDTSDIDLFIVAKKSKLAAVRMWAKLLTQSIGMRVHGNKRAGRFCLSFFVTEDALDLDPVAHEFDPHLAYFVASAKPFFGKQTYIDWLAANEHWTHRYFKRSISPQVSRLKEPTSNALRRIFTFLSPLFEKTIGLYEKRQEEHRLQQFSGNSNVIVTDKIFKFHEGDTRKQMAELFINSVAHDRM